jgi:methyl-accepting chemotaxis protein
MKSISNALMYCDKHGGIWKGEAINQAIREELEDRPTEYLSARKIEMVKETKKTTEVVEDHVIKLNESVRLMIAVEQDLKDKTKTVSASVRSSADKLMQGIERIQKQADYQTLDRYVSLLERAAKAMEELSVIQESGKLDRIAKALS